MNEIEFNDFWNVYPRKIAKGAARKAYEKALKLTSHESLMTGVKNYVAHLEKLKPEKRFVCHASTWLNQERWTDEYEAPKSKLQLTLNQVDKWNKWIRDGIKPPASLVEALRENGVKI